MKPVLILMGLVFATSSIALADEYVRGYVRRDGTYVAPHMRSSPNQYRFDNYSSQGNVNPYTGHRGSELNEFSNPPVFNRPAPIRAPAYQTMPTYPALPTLPALSNPYALPSPYDR